MAGASSRVPAGGRNARPQCACRMQLRTTSRKYGIPWFGNREIKARARDDRQRERRQMQLLRRPDPELSSVQARARPGKVNGWPIAQGLQRIDVVASKQAAGTIRFELGPR